MAVNNLTDSRLALCDGIDDVESGKLPLNTLTMKIQGIVDAAVMGGLKNYDVYFTEEYKQAIQGNAERQEMLEKLSNEIANQVG